MDDVPITTLSSRIDWESKWYRIRRDEILLPDGSQGVYNVLEMPNSAFIVPVLEDGRVVLIRSYRHTLNTWVWEVPAGAIKPGLSPEEGAAEELREEIGGTAGALHLLLKGSTMNGIGNHVAYFFLATGVTLAEPEHEPVEIIEIHPMPYADALKIASSGQINDAISLTALLLAKDYADGKHFVET